MKTEGILDAPTPVHDSDLGGDMLAVALSTADLDLAAAEGVVVGVAAGGRGVD
jgi:hypothetical protein